MADRRVALQAVEVACAAMGLGRPVYFATSAAVTFVTEIAFLRVVEDGQDCPGTLAVAQFVTSQLGGGVPLGEAVAVEVDGVVVWVEAYERLWPDMERTPSWFEVGERLAVLHALDVDRDLRPVRRAAASRGRLACADADLVAELSVHFDAFDTALLECGDPLVVCHADAHRGNLLHVDSGPVWVDFEYAGLGPAALDLAFSLGDTMRYGEKKDTADFLAGYRAGGGEPDLASVLSLARIRDVCGVADYAWYAAADPRVDPALALCRATYLEPFRSTKWHWLSEAEQG